jgi:FdhD protein
MASDAPPIIRTPTTEVRLAGPGPRAGVADVVAVEEPLEIRVGGEPLAVLMRTPGDDRALVAGFLLTEGVVAGRDDITAMGPCRDPNRADAANVYLVELAAGSGLADARLAGARRTASATTSCGLCGKTAIDDIHQAVRPHDAFTAVPEALLAAAGDRARARQDLFRLTGGIHAAALFDLAGDDHPLVRTAEDVGRHNAVDKVLGAELLADRIPVASGALWVSGRASFDIVQKALMAGVVALVCVGAPTSLAVDMAERSRITLVGFAAAGRYNVYCGAVR